MDGLDTVVWLVGLDNLLKLEWSTVGLLTPEPVDIVDRLGVAMLNNCLLMICEPKSRYLRVLKANKKGSI